MLPEEVTEDQKCTCSTLAENERSLFVRTQMLQVLYTKNEVAEHANFRYPLYKDIMVLHKELPQ